MKRVLIILACIGCWVGVYANLSTENLMQFLSLTPEIVASYEKHNKVDSDYISCVIYEGMFYHAKLDTNKALQTYNKAKKLIQEHPEQAKKVPTDLIEALYKISYDLEHLETSVTEEPLATCFKAGNYEAVLPYTNSYLTSIKNYFARTYTTVSEADRYDMAAYLETDIHWHYILSSVYYTNNFSANGEIYDFILFQKQLQLRTIQQIQNTLERSNEPTILQSYQEYQKITTQLAQSNAPSYLNKDSLQNRKNQLDRILAAYSSVYMDKDAVTWKDIQKKLTPGEAAVEFFEFHLMKGDTIADGHVYAALIITPTCHAPVLKILNTKSNLHYFDVENQSDLYNVKEHGLVMAQLFWRDLPFYFSDNDISTIYFAPVGILNTMAIESLPYTQSTPFSHHYHLIRLTSTRELIKTDTNTSLQKATLYGNLAYRLSYETMKNKVGATRNAVEPLPATQEEINEVQSILESRQIQVKTYTKEHGTEESVKQMSGHSPSILHFATHGWVKEQNDEGSMNKTGLILSYGARAMEGRKIPEGAEDGILTSAEIETLDLSSTEIVVLSACNTALGDITTEGVWGLQRAFKKAGVNTVVMSLWQVDDEATALFMQYFYQELMKVKGHHRFYTQKALHAAQFKMSQNPTYADPYYWAAFIAID